MAKKKKFPRGRSTLSATSQPVETSSENNPNSNEVCQATAWKPCEKEKPQASIQKQSLIEKPSTSQQDSPLQGAWKRGKPQIRNEPQDAFLQNYPQLDNTVKGRPTTKTVQHGKQEELSVIGHHQKQTSYKSLVQQHQEEGLKAVYYPPLANQQPNEPIYSHLQQPMRYTSMIDQVNDFLSIPSFEQQQISYQSSVSHHQGDFEPITGFQQQQSRYQFLFDQQQCGFKSVYDYQQHQTSCQPLIEQQKDSFELVYGHQQERASYPPVAREQQHGDFQSVYGHQQEHISYEPVIGEEQQGGFQPIYGYQQLQKDYRLVTDQSSPGGFQPAIAPWEQRPSFQSVVDHTPPGALQQAIVHQNQQTGAQSIVESVQLEESSLNLQREQTAGNEAIATTKLQQLSLNSPYTSKKIDIMSRSSDFEPPRKLISKNQESRPGKKIVVETNYFPLDISKMKPIVYHYDIKMEPETPKYLFRAAINVFLQDYFPNRHPAHDGRKNLFSAFVLIPPKKVFTREVEVTDGGLNNDKKFKISIKEVNQIDMTQVSQYYNSKNTRFPYAQIQVLDIVMRNRSANRLVQVDRSFFTQPKEYCYNLGEGLELWYGFYQSVILGWKPYINIDVAHKGFPSAGKVTEFVSTLLDKNVLNDKTFLDIRQADLLRKHLKGLRINYEIPGVTISKRAYRVHDISCNCAKNQSFKLDDGTLTTVDKYYAKEKRYKILYPNLPLLWVGQASKNILLPLELCSLKPGQVPLKKLSDKQVAKMVKATASPTDLRKEKVEKAINAAQFVQSENMKELGVSVSGHFEKINARVLEPPVLQYDSSLVNVVDGAWRPNKFLISVTINKWCVLNIDPNNTFLSLETFQSELMKRSVDVGMNISLPVQPPVNINRLEEMKEFFEKRKDFEIIFVILPNHGNKYKVVKRAAELHSGVLTQCIRSQTLSKLNPNTVTNILLKVNAKRNGTNHSMHVKPPCLRRPAMIVGADVTHPSPDLKDIPSIAAVSASHDAKAFKYNIVTSFQDPRVEIIQDLESIMRKQLLYFYRVTHHKPEKILVFRDGVSDGQIMEVLNSELQAIRRACTSMQQDDFQPKITFVIVQKRHHTRFFPPKGSNYSTDKKNNNVPVGTVVDTDIVHPKESDFFLMSHFSIQGTARPTKYRVIWDDNNMDEDELEKLTFFLCHMFSRCSRSVSYPTPTYYAHLAAFRARTLMGDEPVNLNRLDLEEKKFTIKEELQMQLPMFFV